jgi:hypothetical protein
MMQTGSRPSKDFRYPPLLKLAFNDDVGGSCMKGPGS